jgi:hypothetical protein
MDELGGTPFVERLRFFNGQQLFASDLQAIDDFDRGMRWLHNSSLHQAGVGNGFAVSGLRGGREVRIQAGYAVDAQGREIVLLDTQVEPVPPVSGEPDGQPAYFDLTVSYPSDDDLEEAETREGVCLPRGAVRLRERPVFCWVRLRRDADGQLRAVDARQTAQIQAGMLIVLARAEVLNCQLNADLSVAQRRRARPPQQPTIRCATIAVTWEVWTLDTDTETETAIGLKATVDTSAMGFRTTPCYSARISGKRPLDIGVGHDRSLLLDGPAYIQEPTATGFGCFVPVLDLARGLRLSVNVLREVLADLSVAWAVTWLAIED